ncbi:putative redox protein [Gammaproteobacteria bacterium]
MTQATVTLISGMQFAVETGSKHTLVIDSGNPETGGRGTGARPMELVAAGVAGCTAMDVISILHKMQQKVTGLQVKITSRDAEEHPKKFVEVHIEYLVTGFSLDEKRVQRAIQLSEERYCPAMATIRPGTQITNSYTLREADPETLMK